MRGRPREPVPKVFAAEIIAWITAGKTLLEYCRQPGKPAWITVYKWAGKDEEFRIAFARAREDGHDVIAEDCMAIADQSRMGIVEIQCAKLRIETRLKLLAKWNPKKYGDKLNLDHAGAVTIHVTTGVPSG